MRRSGIAALVGIAGLALGQRALPAQNTVGALMPMEIGVDAGLAFALGGEGATIVSLPAQQIRVGFFTSNALSIEPSAGLSYSKTGKASSVISYGAGLAALYHFQTSRAVTQWFIKPQTALTIFNGSGESQTRFQLGAGTGVKIPIADRLAWRIEASITHAFVSGDAGDTNLLGFSTGLSFLTP